ncbi:MAG: CPBP family glutamic-type intramembrane protease [Pseudomonadota bacterium]
MFRAPGASDWLFASAVFAAFGVFATAFGLASGLFAFELERDIGALLHIAVVAMVFPGLFEELMFRIPIMYAAQRMSGLRLLSFCASSLVAFVLWHPLNATFLLTVARELFFDWRFLVIAAALGTSATLIALRTRTIWTAVVFHWLAVVAWKAFLGGPKFLTA